MAQWSEYLQLKQEALGLIPGGCPGFFLFQLAYTNAGGVKNLWCSSTVWLLCKWKDLSGGSGALVQFSCYQHRHD